MTEHRNNLSFNQRGKDVSVLHSQLSSIGYTIDTSEIVGELFGQSTYQAVLSFQRLAGLPVTGVVDDATTRAIVSRRETMMMSGPQPFQSQAAPPDPGTASQKPGKPVDGAGEQMPPPVPEKPATDGQQQGAVSGQKAPGTSANVQPGTGARVEQQRRLAAAGGGDGAIASAGVANQAVALYTVTGTVSSPDSAAVGGLVVQVVDKNVGPDLLLAKTTTDTRGRYQASFSALLLLERHKTQPDLQACIYAGQNFLAASGVQYNATINVTLNVNLPANLAVLPSEYETLTGALTAYYAGSLGALQENADRQGITYLANKTGWDAREVAFAVRADQFSQNRPSPIDETTAQGIKPKFYYALFRARFPTNETFYQANPQTIGTVRKQAIAQGVIPQAVECEVASAVQTFQALSTARSTLKELLQLALGDVNQHQQQFADLYVRYQDDLPTFWSTLEQTFGAETTKHLQQNAQLGYLTINNTPLITRLRDAEQQNPSWMGQSLHKFPEVLSTNSVPTMLRCWRHRCILPSQPWPGPGSDYRDRVRVD